MVPKWHQNDTKMSPKKEACGTNGARTLLDSSKNTTSWKNMSPKTSQRDQSGVQRRPKGTKMRSKGSKRLPKRCQEEVPDGPLVGSLLRKRKSLKTTTVSNGIAIFRMPGELKRYQNVPKRSQNVSNKEPCGIHGCQNVPRGVQELQILKNLRFS